VGLFQQWREAPERVRAGKFMVAFFEEAPFMVVDGMYTSLGRDALAAGLRGIGDKSGYDPSEVMQLLLKKAMAGDAVMEEMVRRAMGFASHWYASNMALETVHGITAVFREIQSRKYVCDGSFDPLATFKKAIGA
jgi:hypothetical protein